MLTAGRSHGMRSLTAVEHRPAWPPTLDDSLTRVDAYLGPPLVTTGARRDLARVAAVLPSTLVQWTYLEAHLARARGSVDLIAGIGRRQRTLLASWMSGRAHDSAADSRWAALESVAHEWSRPGTLLSACARRLWLEYDVEAGATPAHPGAFVDLPHPAASGAIDMALRIAKRLRGAVTARAQAALARALGEAPRDAALASIGVLDRHDASVTRVCLTGMAGDDLVPYLQRIGWRGDATRLRALQRSVAGRAAGAPSAAMIHLDVTDVVADAVGLEFPLARGPQRRGVVAERPFLDDLVALGLADGAMLAAVYRWPGCQHACMPHELWPSTIVRRVHHVKLIARSHLDPIVKAYLTFAHQPCGMERTRRARRRTSTHASIP